MNFNFCRDRISIAIAIVIIFASVVIDGAQHWNTTMANMTHSGHNPAFWNLNRSQRLETAARISKQIVAALRARGISLRTNLTSVFPQLAAKIARLPANLKDCYDQSYGYYDDGPRRKIDNIDIFRDGIRSIIERVFKENTDVLSKEDVSQRVKAFVQNLRILANLIIECAAKPKEKRTRWGITSIMLYTRKEFTARTANHYLGSSSKGSHKTKKKTSKHKKKSGKSKTPNSDPRCDLQARHSRERDLPHSFSWKKEGFVSPVRSQGHCGCCYVFSAISALESAYMIKHNAKNKPTQFSPQATLNCMEYKCGGGSSRQVLDHFAEVGAALESKFPYHAYGDDCQEIKPAVRAKDFCYYQNLSNEQMKILLLRNGPAIVGIDSHSMHYYTGGPYNGKCSNSKPTHAVTLVGWSQGNWIIKNSWNKDWGERGYLHLPEGRCAVNTKFGQVLL